QSLPFTEVVIPAPTKTSLVAAPSRAGVNQPVTFTASVSAAPSSAIPTGFVIFQSKGTRVATVRLDNLGRASFTTAALPVGSNLVTATYAPDSSRFLASASGITEVVRQHYFAVGTGSVGTGALATGPPGAARFPATVLVFDPVTGRQ